MLVFGLPSLCTLRQYKRDRDATDMYVTIYYNYILLSLLYHIIYINTHLSE